MDAGRQVENRFKNRISRILMIIPATAEKAENYGMVLLSWER
jgi:hypothetical protein